MNRKESKIKFVGLHAHSTAGSPFDAIGYPNEHMDFAYENGMDALALTDHGNCNGLSYQVMHARKMKKEGKDFKPIFGVEAYFHPSIEDWRELRKEEAAKKKAKKNEEIGGAVVEDEGATKRKKANPLNQRNHLILLAQNQKGLNNIFKLVSDSFSADNFYRFPRLDYEMLRNHSDGVIAASACLGGVYAGDYWRNLDKGEDAILDAMRETTERMQEIFGKRWLAELQWLASPDQHKLNKYILQIAEEYDVPVISTADSHYPRPELWKDRTLYKKLNPRFIAKESGELPEGVEEIGYELYPKNGDQMWEAYKKYAAMNQVSYPDDVVLASIERTHEIAHEWIEDFMPDTTVRLPDFVVPEGMTADEALREKCFFNLAKMGLDNSGEGSQNYIDQLERELKVIADRGFSKYFLTMKEISDKAKSIVLTGPGRGSAAGALVSYVLGITQIDPLKWGLMFSRFLRSDAKDYPDIDYDVSHNTKIKEAIIKEWGETTAVSISNWNTLKPRSLIKDVSRFYGVPFQEVNKVTAVMEREATPKKKAKLGIKSGVLTGGDVLNFDDLKEYSETMQVFLEEYPDIADHLDVLYGQVKSCGRHAGGMVIGENLDRHMPLIRNKEITQTPWSEGQNVRHLEPMGFIKFDLLGIATLRMFEDAISLILRRHHGVKNPTFADIKKFYDENLHPDVIDFDDQKVYKEVFHKGRWAGIFQFAEQGMQHFAKQAKPTSLIDLTALTSIWRPGPMGANVHNDYVKAKKTGDITYRCKELEPYLSETYGFLIFQEQIAQIACGLGEGISEDEGNKLRKILIKKGSTISGSATESDKIYDKFVKGCKKKGISEKIADEIWTDMYNFKQYGFNKSHALSYSVISFQCAWLLTYYPEEWLCGYLNEQGEDSKAKAISEVRALGFEIEEMHINKSGAKWEPLNSTTLVQPLGTVKGIGDKEVNIILEHRPYTDVEQLLFGDSKIKKTSLSALIRCDAMNDLMDDRFEHKRHFWLAVAYDKPTSKKKFLENIEKYKGEDDFSREEIIENYSSLIGSYPFELVLDEKTRKRLASQMIPPISEYDPALGLVWFIPRKIIPKKTKFGKTYWILEVIDETGKTTKIKCWGIRDGDKLHLDRPYLAKFINEDYSERWGFSTRSLRTSFVLIG